MVLDVPGLQRAADLGVVVGVNNHGLRWIHLMVCGEHMLSKSRGSYVSILQSPAVFTKTMEALSTFHYPPRFWRRYVDDTCTALPSNLVDSFHDHRNSIDPCIQFTIKRESDGQLPFLDILLNREEDGSINTSVYRKATHTDQYLSFHSHYPAAHKWAVVRTLMCRAEALSSSGVSRAQEEKLVSQALQGNGYPKGFIHKHTCPQPDQWTPRDQVARGSVTLPYISGLSESIRRVLAPLAIQVTFRPHRTLRQELVHPKDPVPANRRKGVVYSIPCAECPRTYIGQTGRSLDYCLREHRRALKNGDVGSSALAEHVFSANHEADPLHAGVLAHPAPPVPPQQGEGHLARTLCCTTVLTVHPSGVIPFLCCHCH